MWLHKNGQADRKNSSHSRKCLCEFTTVRLRGGKKLTLNFPTILSSSVMFWSSSSPPFPLNRLKQCSQSSKLSNSLSSSFGYTLLDQRIHLKTHFLTFCFALLTFDCPAPSAPPALASSSLPALPSSSSPSCLCLFCCLSLESHQFWFLSTGLWRWGRRWGEEEQRTPDMNPTWKLPKAAVTQYSKHLTEAYTTAIYISVEVLGYLVVGQGPLCQQLAWFFLHKSQSHQNTGLHVVYILVMRQVILYACVYILRPNCGVCFLSFLWTTFMVSVWTICTGQRTGWVVFFPTYGNLDSCQRLHGHNLGFTTARKKKQLVSSWNMDNCPVSYNI